MELLYNIKFLECLNRKDDFPFRDFNKKVGSGLEATYASMKFVNP